MAKKVSIIIEAVDKTKSAVGAVRGRIAKLGALIAKHKFIATAAFAAIAAAIRAGVKAYLVQEKAVASLNAALENAGASADKYSGSLQRLASEIQSVTDLGDEEIIQQQALAVQMGVSADRMDDVTIAAVGLAKKLGVDLKTAMGLIVRAGNGDTAMLTRYGIKLDEVSSKTDKFNELLAIGAESFDLATEQGKTLADTLERQKNAYGDLQEAIGGAFAEGSDLVEQNQDLQTIWENLAQDRSFLGLIQVIGKAFGTVAKIILGVVKVVMSGVKIISASIESLALAAMAPFTDVTFKQAFTEPFKDLGEDLTDLLLPDDVGSKLGEKADQIAKDARSKIGAGGGDDAEPGGFQFDDEAERESKAAFKKRMRDLDKIQRHRQREKRDKERAQEKADRAAESARNKAEQDEDKAAADGYRKKKDKFKREMDKQNLLLKQQKSRRDDAELRADLTDRYIDRKKDLLKTASATGGASPLERSQARMDLLKLGRAETQADLLAQTRGTKLDPHFVVLKSIETNTAKTASALEGIPQ